MRYIVFAAAFCLLLVCLPANATAETVRPVQQNNSYAVWFENWIGLSNASMRVATPDGEIIDIFAERGTPVFELSGQAAVDGVYRYELRAATEEMVKNRRYNAESGTDEDAEFYAKQLYFTGYFIVQSGAIVAPEDADPSKI